MFPIKHDATRDRSIFVPYSRLRKYDKLNLVVGLVLSVGCYISYQPIPTFNSRSLAIQGSHRLVRAAVKIVSVHVSILA